MKTEEERRVGLTRRGLLASAGTGAVAVGAGAGGVELLRGESEPDVNPPIPFEGRHQAGIVTPPPAHLHFAAFDLAAATSGELRQLLGMWSDAGRRLTAGRPVGAAPTPGRPPEDTGEATGLGHSRLTITFGLGPELFEKDGEDRLGLRHRMPRALAPLPAFRGDALEPAYSGGDLCVQVCADDPQVAFHAMHTLTRAAAELVVPRWLQLGFRPTSGPVRHRNLMGFEDGTRNLDSGDRREMAENVWASRRDGQAWMEHGSYLVIRRIRMLLDVWDATTLAGQEAAIGRRKASGALLGGRLATAPTDSHVRRASPEENGGARILRRSYSYTDGIDRATGQLDAGLIFLCFQRDPARQFVPIQRRLAEADGLSQHILHTGSGLFACPPGARRGGFVGEALFA